MVQDRDSEEDLGIKFVIVLLNALLRISAEIIVLVHRVLTQSLLKEFSSVFESLTSTSSLLLGQIGFVNGHGIVVESEQRAEESESQTITHPALAWPYISPIVSTISHIHDK